MRTSGCVALILLFVSTGLLAQPSGFAGSFSRLGFGPRGMGMGNALTATDREGIYAYYNPALAALTTEGNQVDIFTSAMSFDRTLHGLSGTFRLPPSAGISLTFLNANITDIDGRTVSGYHTSDLSTHEYQLLTSFGVNIHDNVSIGAGIKLNLADYHTSVPNARGVGIDIGVLYSLTEKLALGIAMRDLLASYTWNSGGLYGDDTAAQQTDDFPARLSLGGTYMPFGNFLLVMNYGLLLHESTHFHQLRLGGSYLLHERLSVRAGWQIEDVASLARSHRPSAGFSLHLPFDSFSPSIDYALVWEPNQISTMHVFGLRLNL